MLTTLIPRGYEREVADRVKFMPRDRTLVKGLYNVPIAEDVATLADADRALAELGYARSHEWREGLCESFSTHVYRKGPLFTCLATSVVDEVSS
jgi:hypothetical protein